jgi:hypothetical protein
MGWQQNPNTGESYWVEDKPTPQQQPKGAQPQPFQGTPDFWANQNKQQQPQQQAQPQNPWGQPPPKPTTNKSGHTNTTAPFGMDQTMPGVAEQNWEYNQNRWAESPQLDWANTQLPQFGNEGFGENYNKQQMGSYGSPGEGQQYWDGISGKFNEIGKYQQPNLAAESYNRTVQNLPGSIQPTFDSAFDRARDKSVGAANSQASSRGAYGSSAALNGVNSVISDIEAARASKHSDFALQDSANQRNWLDSAANQGRSADLSSLGAFGANLNGMQAFGDMAFRSEGADLARDKFASDTAFGVQDAEQGRLGMGIESALGLDSAALNRLNSGHNVASDAQGHRDSRIQGALDNTRGFQNDMTGFLSNQFENVFQGDQDAFMQWMDSIMGVTQDQKNNAERNQERNMEGAQAIADLASKPKGP